MARELVELVGLPELKAAIEERVVALEAVKAAIVAEEAALVEEDAKHAAPVLEGDDPDGHIRDDIKAEHAGAHAVVTVENRHAAFQEFGTSRNAAQPFMHPAASAARKRFPEVAAARIRKAVE